MLQDTPDTSSRVRNIAKLLSGIGNYVAKNINKRFNTILQLWEVAINLRNLSKSIYSLTDFLRQDLNNDEYFYKNAPSTFLVRVSDMNEFTRKQ